MPTYGCYFHHFNGLVQTPPPPHQDPQGGVAAIISLSIRLVHSTKEKTSPIGRNLIKTESFPLPLPLFLKYDVYYVGVSKINNCC
jgi:hypothetical protein